ncbi:MULTISPECIES: SLC13 family permease [Haloarcula]|uniref:Membrane protein n=1 Tax=Haloarcula pellucida TaxID=1427151 RepID=A0A830GN22_9EURY|nr:MULTISPECIES: SLC13 family permease [Halomicroarcula]MBX0348632.1 anion permease [Halomicroarcula pellucida]MDS0278435.1 anion permease [Halomicroarcula sp. S1AR25-4]GGN92501.1 membrane protein [Halomicroarcula pellucida]
MTDGRTDRIPTRRVLLSPEALGLVAAALVLLAGATLPPPGNLTMSAQRVLAVFLTALVLWLTEPVPYVVSSVLSVTLLFALGTVDSFEAAATGYTSTLVFFLLLLLLLGNAIGTVGLDRQLARRLLSAESTPRAALRSVAGSMLALAFVMPSAMARAVTFVPIVEQLESGFGLADDSGFERAGFLLLGHVNPIASMALMTGGGMALVTSEIVSNSVRPVTWVEWAVLMLPPTVLLYALATVAAGVVTTVDGTTTVAEAENAPLATDGDGSQLTRDQRLVAVVVAGAVVSWVAGSFVGLPTVVPAAVAVTVLALPGIGVITTEDVTEVSWGIIFLIGAMLSILEVMEATGAIDVVVDVLTRVVPFGALAHWQVVAVLLALAVGIRVLFSTGSAAIVVALPILLEFGGAFGVDRLYLALSALLVVGSTTLLPFNTTAVLISMDRGPLSHRDVASFGLLTMGLSLLVVAVAWVAYWPLVA